MRLPGRLLLLLIIAACAPAGSAMAANTEPGGGGGTTGAYCASSCGVGGGGSDGQVRLWDIWNIDRPIDMVRATQAPTCRRIADEGDSSPTPVGTDTERCEEEAAQRVAGGTVYGEIACWSHHQSRRPPDAIADIKVGSPCLVQPPPHYKSVSAANGELHQNIELMRSGRLADGRMMEGIGVAWIVRAWRVKVDPDAVRLPVRTRAGADGEQDPRYPVFERRMNLRLTDGRSDEGLSDGGGTGPAVSQEAWWNGGPNGGARDVAGQPGNWWLDIARAGPVGTSQTAAQNAACDARYRAYRNATIARNGGGSAGRERLERVAPLLANSESAGEYLFGFPTANRCLYTWSEQNGMNNDAEWFMHTSTEGNTAYRRESIALGWDTWDGRKPYILTPDGKDRIRGTTLSWRVQAPPGYLYAVQIALIDAREQILTSNTRFAAPSGIKAPPEEGTTKEQPAPGTSARGPGTLPTGSTLAAGDPKEHRLTIAPASDTPFGAADAAPTQQMWFRSSTAYWYDYGQKFDPTNRWIRGDAISLDERNRDGESVTSTTPVSQIAGSTNTTGPSGIATEGVVKAIEREHVYRADRDDPMGVGQADGTSLPIPNSNIVWGRARDNQFVRTFAVAQTSPSVRIAGQVQPLQFSGRAIAETAGWAEAKLPGTDVTAWKSRGADSWQPDCAVGWNPCIESIDARPRDVWQPIERGSGENRDRQLAGAFVPHSTAPSSDGKARVDGFFQVRLQTRAADGAVGSAGIRSLMLRRADNDEATPVRAIWEPALEGTRPRNTVRDGDWSITWCRPGEPTSSLMVRAGSDTLGDIDDDDVGDAGCQADYHQWSWRLKSDLACATEAQPGVGQCVRPDKAYYCPAGTNYAPPGEYLRANLGLRAPGRQAVKQSDMPEMRGNITSTEPGERDTYPWKANQAPCVVPGVFTTGSFVKVNATPKGYTYGSKGCRNGITGININYRWKDGPDVFRPGKDRAWLVRYYENQFADATSEVRVQLETWSAAQGTCINRANETRFVAGQRDSDNLDLRESNGRFAFQTAGAPRDVVRVQDRSTPRKYFGMPGADLADFPAWGATYRPGHIRLGAATGWVHTPHQEHCTDRRDGTNVRSCPPVDAQHTGHRLPAGNYFVAGTVRDVGDAATGWRLSVRKFQRKGSNWNWSMTPAWAPAHATDVIGLQPSR